LHTGSTVLAQALARFVAAYPGSSSVDDLVQALPAAARNAEGRALVREGLLPLLDGSRDADAISAAIAAGGRDGQLAELDDPGERIRSLARAALLLA
jgi:hypothetical protein